jgi:hypothetical protein
MNWDKHDVTAIECEQIFFNKPLIVKRDSKHSKFENRYYALGRTNMNRLLFAVFTVRNEKIRIIVIYFSWNNGTMARPGATTV